MDFNINPTPLAAEPFGEYFVRSLMLRPGYVADIASSCATLYLFRSDPDELRQLTRRWADCATLEIGESGSSFGHSGTMAAASQTDHQHAHTQVLESPCSHASPTVTGVDVVVHAAEAVIGTPPLGPSREPTFGPFATGAALAPPPSSHRMHRALSVTDFAIGGSSSTLTIEELIVRFLTMLQFCIETYFSYRWDDMAKVVAINQEHKAFVERELIPRIERRRVSLTGTPNSLPLTNSRLSSADDAAIEPPTLPSVADNGLLSCGEGGRDGDGTDEEDHPTRVNTLSNIFDEDLPEFVREGVMPPPASTDNFAIPSRSVVWATELNFAELRHRAAATGMLLVFHAGFSAPSCQTVKDLFDIFETDLATPEAQRAAFATLAAGTASPITGGAMTPARAGGSGGSTVMSVAVTPTSANAGFPRALSMTSPSSVLSDTSAWANSGAAIGSGVALLQDSLEVCALHGPPLFAVVNSPGQPCLTAAYAVQWFPTIIFIPPQAPTPSPTADEKDLSPLSYAKHAPPPPPPPPAEGGVTFAALQQSAAGDQHLTYPERGIRQRRYLLEWIATQGRCKVHLRRFVSNITHIVLLEKRMRFAEARESKSAALRLQRLQGSCRKRPPPHTADDPPVFVFLGGGMAAGKTTAAAALSKTAWWERHGCSAVIVDADAFKFEDPLFKSGSPDIHSRSIVAAEHLLVDAVNEGRDIVFDGTMSWLPHIRQTIEMVRRAHTHRFQRSEVGYNPARGLEEYWDCVGERAAPLAAPYRIRFIGITVDPEKAVQRGILRHLNTGRPVPVRAQLRSFRLFATAFPAYCALCDSVVLYDNNVKVDLEAGELPVRIAEKRLGQPALAIHNEAAFAEFERHQCLNDQAASAAEMWLDAPQVADWLRENLDRKAATESKE